jgi:excisionase family DNA binding protein
MNTQPFAASSLRNEQAAAHQVDTSRCGMDTPSRKFEGANPLLTDREACEYLRLCPRQLYAMRKRGLIPFVQIGGRTVRYRLRDLDVAIEAMTVVAQPGETSRPATKRPAPAAQPSLSPSPEFAALLTPNTHE